MGSVLGKEGTATALVLEIELLVLGIELKFKPLRLESSSLSVI